MVAAAVLTAFAVAVPDAVASPTFLWSAPVLVDHQAPFGVTNNLESLACPSSRLCVAGDDNGDVVISTDPGDPGSWTVVRADGAGNQTNPATIVSLACRSATLCVGVDGFMGDVIGSSNPAGGGNAWRQFSLPTRDLGTVACATAPVCVALDGSGSVFTSTDPLGGARAWKRSMFAYSTGPQAAACTPNGVCVAVVDDSRVFTTSHPAGGGSTWKARRIAPNDYLASAACPTNSLCVLGSILGKLYVNTDPGNPASTWTVVSVGHTLRSIACPSAETCVGVDDTRDLLASAGGVSGPWQIVGSVTTPAGDPTISAIACPTAHQCIAVNNSPSIISSSSPTTSGSWTEHEIDRSNGPSSISCPSEEMCAIADASGNVLTSTTPTKRRSWRLRHIGTAGINAISCPAPSLCVAGDATGNILWATEPTSGTWTTTPVADPVYDRDGNLEPVPVTGVSCASTRFCIAGYSDIWGDGHGLVTQNPTGPREAWSVDQGIARGSGFTSASCPSPSFCAVVLTDHSVDASTHPASADGNANGTHVSPSRIRIAFVGISCTSSSLCIAVATCWTRCPPRGPRGIVARSRNAGAKHPSWTAASHPGAGDLIAVDCPSAALCVATSDSGDVLTSTNPAAARPRWTLRKIDGHEPITAISCPSARLCVAVDERGNVIVGTVHGR